MGITVHRKDCNNFKSMVSKDPSREILVNWDRKILETKTNKYNFSFEVLVRDRLNMLMDIVNLIANHKINVTSLNSNEMKRNGEKLMKVRISIEINSKMEYDHLLNNIMKIRDVISVER